jgi:opacity protein-like surface antigen
MGPKVLYFINPDHPSIFFGGGLGLALWEAGSFEDDVDTYTWTSFGFELEAGYEFSRRVNVSFHILYGNPSKTESGVTTETNFLNFGATLNLMGY